MKNIKYIGYLLAVVLSMILVLSCKTSCTSENDPSDILALYPEREIVPLLANYKWHGNVYGNERKPDPFTMLFFSDIHGDQQRLSRVMKFYHEYERYFDAILHAGDSVEACYENDWGWWDESGAAEVLNICGNHDTWTGKPETDSGIKPWTTGYSAKTGFERYIKPYIDIWGLTGYLDNTMCWYKDYDAQNIRIIALDSSHFKEKVLLQNGEKSDTYPTDKEKVDDGEQQKWLESVLKDALENGMSVICTSHIPPEVEPIESTFMELLPDQLSAVIEEYYVAVQEFINKGGEFITWLNGHKHQDWFGTVKGYPDQLLITIDTARDLRKDGTTWSNNTKPDNTVAMDCFNILSIDPCEKFISLQRIGSEYDKYGRHIGGLVYNYRDRKLIWND